MLDHKQWIEYNTEEVNNPSPEMNLLKCCIKCNVSKPLNEFVKRGESYRGTCKKCYCDYHKKYGNSNRDKLNVNRAFDRKSRPDRGLCRVCTEPVIAGKRVCEKHYVVDIISKTLGKADSKTADILLIRFYQNPFCPYTGEALTLGVNAHLDHVLSLKNRPDLKGDINNIEWVSETANLSKNGFNKDEFINFCKVVANRFN